MLTDRHEDHDGLRQDHDKQIRAILSVSEKGSFSSSSKVRYLSSPVSFRSLSAFLRRRTGARVSGMNNGKMKQAPTKMTIASRHACQSNPQSLGRYRDPCCYDKISKRRCRAYKRVPEKRAIGTPRFSTAQTSMMVPPTQSPAIIRATTRVAAFFASMLGSMKMK